MREGGDRFTNLHVSGIPKEWTDVQLKELFAEFGEIQSVFIKEGDSEQAWVTFKSHDDAVRAIEALNAKKEINGKVIFVSKHISKVEDNVPGKVPQITRQLKETFKSNIIVRNIPLRVTEAEFEQAMSKCGKIISMKLREQERKTKTGETYANYKVGYVCYEDIKNAQKCIQTNDQTNIFGYGKALSVDFW